MSTAAGEAPLAAAADPAEAVERYLLSLVRPEARSYAERAGQAQAVVRSLLAELGNPHAHLRCVHLAGSKGKGSTALLLEALLEAGGLRTATFTSPHLERFTERFRVGGAEVEAERLAAVLDRLRPLVAERAAADPDTAPGFFEVMTAAALVLFARDAVDVAILECGLGGRYDATNVVTPAAAVITGIEMEHVDKLGPGLVDIARHKAGIVKSGVPLVCGRLPPVACAEIFAEAEALGAPLWRLGRDFELRSDDGRGGFVFHAAGVEIGVTTTIEAPHLERNAGLAMAAALGGCLLDADALAEAAPKAFRELRLPARVELLARAPWLLVDGAHTADSARELAAALRRLPAERRVLLVSLSGAKHAGQTLGPLLRAVDEVVVTRAEPLRSRAPAEVAAEIARDFPTLVVQAMDEPAAALAAALERTPPQGLLCAAGSMYMAGLARRLLRAELARRAAA